MISISVEVRPKAGPTVWLGRHRYPIAMSPAQARLYAVHVLEAADQAESKDRDLLSLSASRLTVKARDTAEENGRIAMALDAAAARREAA